MEPILETVELDADEANELLFKVQIQGTDPNGARVRMVCEGPEMGYVFAGKAGPEGLVRFDLPAMKDRLAEGTYLARVEVMVDNKYFTPVQFQVNFRRPVKVVAEAVTVAPRKVAPTVQVTATPVVRKAPEAAPKPPAPKVAETLKERFGRRQDPTTKGDQLDEEAILEAAKAFVRQRRSK